MTGTCMVFISHVGKPERLSDLLQMVQEMELTLTWTWADDAQPGTFASPSPRK